MTTTDGFAHAARLDDLAPGQLLGVVVEGERVCLARQGNEIFALEDRCTHALFPLSRGDLLPNGTVQCAWHGAQFDCRTGTPLRGPASADAQTFDILLRDGDIYVRPRR
jgi:3-phenylpropionate/trans-cinnamate dioxygenase ferredoxin subunit